MQQLFSAPHYNAIAKEIREVFPLEDYADDHIEMRRRQAMDERTILTTLAINLAKRFKQDNPRFDPLRFLDQCSPNTDLYPLSELWEERDAART